MPLFQNEASRTTIGLRARRRGGGGGGAVAPPATEIVIFRATTLERKHYKIMLSA